MKPASREAMGWLIGAALVVAAVAIYLWLTAPEPDLLPSRYSVL